MRSLIEDLKSSLVSHSRRLIENDIHWLLLSNGAADLNDNVIFFGFEGNNNEPSFVAKVPRLPKNERIVKTEYEYLVEVWNRLGNDAAMYVPEPLALFQVDRHPVLVISFLLGEAFLFLDKKKIWHNTEDVLSLSQEVAYSLRQLHDKVSEPLNGNEQVLSGFLLKAETFIRLYKPTEKERQALAELTDRLKSYTASCKTIIQGDVWHGNIIRNAAHGNLMFTDWQYARWSTDVSLDVYLFLMAGAVAITQGSDEEHAKMAVEVLKQWRLNVFPAYLAAYGMVDCFSLLSAKYGMLLCCVEKAVRAVLDFGYNQSDDLTWRNMFSELVDTFNDGFFDGI